MTSFGRQQPTFQTGSGITFANQSPYSQDITEDSPSGSTDTSMIDPALTGPAQSPTYQDSMYNSGRPEPYAQSYERYQSLTPGTSAKPQALTRIRQSRMVEDGIASLTESTVLSSNVSSFSNRIAPVNTDSPTSTPSFFTNVKDGDVPLPDITSERPLKRVRYVSSQDAASPSYDASMPPPTIASYTSYNVDSQASSVVMAGHSSVGTPLTPASSHSDEAYKAYPAKLSPHPTQDSPDLRRLSVSSLLSGPPGIPYQNDRYAGANNRVQDWSLQTHDVYQDTITYGVDRGFKDLDIGKNDDLNAISGASPLALRDHLELVLDKEGDLMPIEFGFGMEIANTAFENGAYYDKPVPISIPRILEPLPSKLHDNPMNLLVGHRQFLTIIFC